MKYNLRMFKSGGRSVAFSVLAGVIAAVVISLLLNMGLTSLVMKGHVEEKGTKIFMFLIRAVSVMVGGMVATALSKEKLLLVIGLTSVAFLVILVGLGIIFFENAFHNFGGGALSVATGAACACVLKLKVPTKKKHSVKYRK